jgi:uncharacterized protein (DUF1684 family)
MSARLAVSAALAVALTGCARDTWPDPPAVDQAQYQTDYEQWKSEQQDGARESTKIVGVWALPDGDTAFGSDKTLPIALPVKSVPGRAGVFRRAGEKVTVTAAPGVDIRGNGGNPVKPSDSLEGELTFGSVRLLMVPMGDGRVFVNAMDEEHPLLKDLPMVQTYPVDERWRVAARFDAFDAPKPTRVADVRGGTTEYPAVGRLTFRIGDQEQQLTAFGFPGSDEFFLMFKDATNATTTYGARIMHARVVAKGEWTVLDFNVASNPPCAYSPYTTCPMPPPENRLAVAIEAGEKRFPTGLGFAQP